MILWHLDQKWGGLPAGSCITDEKYKLIYYLDRCLFSPIQEFEIVDMIEFKDEMFCIENGIDRLLFYTKLELELFLYDQN